MRRPWNAIVELKLLKLCMSPKRNTFALDEEGSLLRIERFERGEIHDRRVHLDLSEVRIHRRVQGEAGGQAVLQIHTRGRKLIGAVAEGIVRIALEVLRPHARIGKELEVAARLERPQSGQMAVARDARVVLEGVNENSESSCRRLIHRRIWIPQVASPDVL